MSATKAIDPATGQLGKEYPILWWYSYFNEKAKFEGHLIDFCGLPYTCRMTHDRNMYKNSSTVVFLGSMYELDFKDLPPPQDPLNPKKAWIMHSLEAPLDFQRDPLWKNPFTHVWSFRHTDDFVQTYFKAGRSPDSYLSSIMAKPAFTIEEKNQRRQQGLAPVAWIVSNCRAHSRRHYFVQQLRKHINVDIYGNCMKNKAWPKYSNGTDMSIYDVIAPYKFYLAIENNNCDEYVTEKLERPFRVGAVPIVDGPNDYTPFIPANNSVVREDAFESPQALAQYIHQLDQDDEAYMRHLNYKFPTNEVDKTTLAHLSPELLKMFDTGDTNDGPGSWGYDLQGVECRICQLTHHLAEGLVTLTPERHLPTVDETCEFGKWSKMEWAFEFWAWHVLFISTVITLALLVPMNRRLRSSVRWYVNFGLGKVKKWCGKKEYDEAKEPFIPLSARRED